MMDFWFLFTGSVLMSYDFNGILRVYLRLFYVFHKGLFGLRLNHFLFSTPIPTEKKEDTQTRHRVVK